MLNETTKCEVRNGWQLNNERIKYYFQNGWQMKTREQTGLPEEEMIDISSPSTDSWRTSFRVFINILTCRRIVPSAYTLIHLALSHTHPLNSPLIKSCRSVYACHDLPFRYLLALLIMASSAANKLTTLQGWKDFFEGAEIPEEEAENYARIMLANRMSRASDLTKEVLQDLEITTMGDVLNILRATKATKKEKVQIRPNI